MYTGTYRQQIEKALDERGHVPSQLVYDILEEIGSKSVSWDVEDFRSRAQERRGEDWKKVYDETKFQEALERMIDKHDAELGISWITIDFFLDEFCRTKNFDDDGED